MPITARTKRKNSLDFFMIASQFILSPYNIQGFFSKSIGEKSFFRFFRNTSHQPVCIAPVRKGNLERCIRRDPELRCWSPERFRILRDQRFAAGPRQGQKAWLEKNVHAFFRFKAVPRRAPCVRYKIIPDCTGTAHARRQISELRFFDRPEYEILDIVTAFTYRYNRFDNA